MVSVATAWAVVVSISLTYWLSNALKSVIIIHNENAALIRWLQGYKSDLKITAIIFVINLTVTYGIGLLGSSYIYPAALSIFTEAGVRVIAISAATFYFSQLLRMQSDSWDEIILGIRILSAAVFVGSLYFVPSINQSINSAVQEQLSSNTSGNFSKNASNMSLGNTS